MHGSFVSLNPPTIAIASNPLLPSEIALKKATLSAQQVKEYDEDSILHPVNISPFFDSSAAPTLNFEYGE